MMHVLKWRLHDVSMRKKTDLTVFAGPLNAEKNRFNATCRSGKMDIIKIDPGYIILTYDSPVRLKKPGAALHGFSQGLIDRYGAFRGLLTSTQPAHLFESKPAYTMSEAGCANGPEEQWEWEMANGS